MNNDQTDVFRVIFIGRRRGAIGAFCRWECRVESQSIARTHIIQALGDAFEINAIVLRENLTQGRDRSDFSALDWATKFEPTEPTEVAQP